MKLRRLLSGSVGFLSLLGFVGVFTDERLFLSFFAFAVEFEHFFSPSDEALDRQILISAAAGFFLGMLVSAAAALAALLAGEGGSAALGGAFAWGWAAAVVAHSLCSAALSFRERWFSRDKE